MDLKEIKKILSGLGLAGLLAGASLMAAGCATDGKSSWTGDKSPPAKSGWSGDKSGAGGTDKPKGGSSWT